MLQVPTKQSLIAVAGVAPEFFDHWFRRFGAHLQHVSVVPLNAIWQHCLGNEFAQMLQVGAGHDCAVRLCGRRNTCNGDQGQSRCYDITWANELTYWRKFPGEPSILQVPAELLLSPVYAETSLIAYSRQTTADRRCRCCAWNFCWLISQVRRAPATCQRSAIKCDLTALIRKCICSDVAGARRTWLCSVLVWQEQHLQRRSGCYFSFYFV